MIANRRTLTYVAIALIVGAALALAVALSRSDSAATSSRPAAAPTQAQGGVLGDTAGAGTIASADPAKQEPLLDKFTAKDPFIPFATATPTPIPTSTSTPNPSGGTAPPIVDYPQPGDVQAVFDPVARRIMVTANVRVKANDAQLGVSIRQAS